MFRAQDAFKVDSKISWREDTLGRAKIVLLGVPQTHSLFILERLGRELFLLVAQNASFEQLCEKARQVTGVDGIHSEVEQFIKNLIAKEVLSLNDLKD